MQEGASCVRNEDGVISVDPMDYVPDPRGLGCALFDRMTHHKHSVAQVDGLTGEEELHEDLLKRCVRTAIVMSKSGITSEDLVAICSYGHLNCCVPYFAAIFLGVKVTYLDADLCLSDCAHLLGLLQPKIIFVGPEALTLIESAAHEAHLEAELITFASSSYRNFDEFLVPSEDEEKFYPTPARDLDDTAIIFFSGGTTGLPKGVCMSHRSLLTQTYSIVPHVNYVPQQRFKRQLSLTSLYWISTGTLLLICMFFDRTNIVYPKFNVEDFWNVLERTKVQVIVMGPSHVRRICIRGKPKSATSAILRQVFVTGGPISKEQILDLKAILPGVDVMNLYGTSEAGGYSLSFRPHVYSEEVRLIQEKPESCGRPRRGIKCKVVDNETGEILGPNQRGELRIFSDFQMTGYFQRDSSGCWDADGFLKSGEAAYYDEDYCFFIVDRIREMLKFRSWYIAPAKLEGVLQSHPAVATAVVVGLPHPEDGDHPVGVVVLRPSAVGTVAAEDIEQFVNQRVDDKHKLRGGVRIVDHIPLTPTGKIRRRDMREKVLSGEI